MVVGVGLVGWSWMINGQGFMEPDFTDSWLDLPWFSNVLVSLGTAIILFSPLFWLTERLTEQVERAEETVGVLGSRVAEAQREVGDAQAKLQIVEDATNPELRRDAAVNLNEQVQEGMSAARKEDDALYASLAFDPTPERIIEALLKARADGLISEKWPRCELLMSYMHVRWVIDGEPSGHELHLKVEDDTGKVLHDVLWANERSADAVFVEIGKLLVEHGGYPGDNLFFAAELPRQLSDLLLYASKYRPSVTGNYEIARVVEIFESGWILTDSALIPKSYRSYHIAINRLGEIDWSEHIRNKGWPESLAFAEALRMARELNGTSSE